MAVPSCARRLVIHTIHIVYIHITACVVLHLILTQVHLEPIYAARALW
jgi:hypothetical protein